MESPYSPKTFTKSQLCIMNHSNSTDRAAWLAFSTAFDVEKSTGIALENLLDAHAALRAAEDDPHICRAKVAQAVNAILYATNNFDESEIETDKTGFIKALFA